MDDYIRVRLSSEEKERWFQEAEKRGLTLSEYIRRVMGASIASARGVAKGASGEKGLPKQEVGGVITYFK
jgi:hypothetical protein